MTKIQELEIKVKEIGSFFLSNSGAKNCIYFNTTEGILPLCSVSQCMAWKWVDETNKRGCCGIVYPMIRKE